MTRRGCDVWSLDEEDYDMEYPGDRDVYDIMEDVDRLFRHAEVRPSSKEGQYLACLDDDGQVMGGGVFGTYGVGGDEEYLTFTFSVVVSPLARRRGIAASLVREMEDYARMAGDSYELPVRMEAWVVNQNMAKLLDKLGFDSTGSRGEWSRQDPYYEKEIA
jgi:GNAT superfamily N-acetyltransferase